MATCICRLWLSEITQSDQPIMSQIAYGNGLWVKGWKKDFTDRKGQVWKLKFISQDPEKVYEVWERELVEVSSSRRRRSRNKHQLGCRRQDPGDERQHGADRGEGRQEESAVI